MPIEIKMLTLGVVQTNAYLVGDSESGNAILIDPVDQAETIFQTAQNAGWTITHILATHAHFDHIMASHALKELTSAQFWIHQEAVPMLENLPNQGKRFGFESMPQPGVPDRLITEPRETFSINGLTIESLYTPGHAPGHVSFYLPDHQLVFSGDSLFAGSVGRTDLPGGSHKVLMQSIFTMLMPLGDDVQVLPGHMQPTTIGRERKTNPFLLSYDENDE
jgi:glyoxylase-like metal-dependent hydrolase (beta-lactamase superfamily II)